MLFKVLKRAIERGNFESKEEMADKIAILFDIEEFKWERGCIMTTREKNIGGVFRGKTNYKSS